MKELFKLESYFIHKKLIWQLLSPSQAKLLELKLYKADNYTQNLKDLYIHHEFAEAIMRFLQTSKTTSLEEKLLKEETLVPKELVWFENTFYFKGIVKAKDCYNRGTNPSYSFFHTKLERYNNLKIEGKFNFEHVFSSTALDRLSGQNTKYILGYIDEIHASKISIRPVLIGDKILSDETIHAFHAHSLHTNIEDIDEFKDVKSVPFNRRFTDLNINKSIPEANIKKWFAEIINEDHVPKDWGGETSDLFTSHLHINGKRYRAAFLLKGPSKFHPMTVKDLGKNGNQIVRLFEEPAEIYIIQHCHQIKPEIHKTMEAFATRFDKLNRYCLIDGTDTLRILKAYNKIPRIS